MVIWVGYGMFSKISIAFLVAFFPIVVNTVVGLKEVEPELLELARINRGSAWDVFKKIRLPNSLPYMFAGIKVAIVLSVTGAIVAEFVAANEGLGYLVLQANYSLDTAFALVILLILAGCRSAYFVGGILPEKTGALERGGARSRRFVLNFKIAEESEASISTLMALAIAILDSGTVAGSSGMTRRTCA